MESSKYAILVVDDEGPIRNLVVAFLIRPGHWCVEATDGVDALKRMKENRIDAIVTDIKMPQMDGITLTKELLKLYPDLPIMVMTGRGDEYTAESAIAAGAREFIKKPFSIHEFAIRFDKMMRDHKEEKTLQALSLTDELTGLYNRRRFLVLTDQYLKVAIRKKTKLLLLFIDMDDLKSINDHYGHNEGDQALIDLANILKKTFRESDIVARLGGDEFVVLLESDDGNRNGETIVTRLYKNLKDHNAKESRCYLLSISVGSAPFYPEYPVSIDALLSKADTLMYAQKRKSKINQ